MKYQVIFLLICGIRSSYQIYDIYNNTCFGTITGRRDVCCYNYEWTDGMCKECKIGTTTNAGGQCMSCTNNTFGYKCIEKCVCNQSQRCDTEVGCILKTSNSTMHTTYTGPTEQALLPNKKVTANESTVIRIGTSKAHWIVYTLCITSCFCLTGFGHWFRSYRRRSVKVRAINEKAVSELLTPYTGDYNDVNKKPLTFVTTGSNITPQASHNETINFGFDDRQSYTACNEDDGYFDLNFTMKEDVNHALRKESLSTSAFNSNVVSQDNTEFHKPLHEYCQEDSHACKVSVTVHDRQSNTACYEDDEDDEARYFDLYFGMKEDVNHKVENHLLRKESLSTSSFNSNVVSQDDTEFHKQLPKYCQEDSHACELSFTVHQCIKHSSWSEEDASSNIYSNVYQLLQKDRQLNSQMNGNRQLPDSNTVHDKTMKTAIPSTYRTGNLQDCNKYAESEKIINACGSIESNTDKSINEKTSKTL